MKKESLIRYVAFSDDSSHSDGRFHSLSLLTLRRDTAVQIHTRYSQILTRHSISKEFKWTNLQSDKYRDVANEMMSLLFENLKDLRVDTIIWDLQDSRHVDLAKRDNNENRVRMYYHLLSSTLGKRWPLENSVWDWYPDKQSSVDWELLTKCLNNKKRPCVRDLFNQNPNFAKVNLNPPVPSDSQKQKLIQIADLFAGVGNYSYGEFSNYLEWHRKESGQRDLFNPFRDDFSNGQKYKYPLIRDLKERCNEYGLRLSLNNTKGFSTYTPNTSYINFWKYEPQTNKDRAPTKA